MKNELEYSTMAGAEGSHWWYRALHTLVLNAIGEKTGDKSVRILDAGCGTGGLVSFLSSHGYTDITGFDVSETAVQLAASKAPQVFQLDVRETAGHFPAESFDFIVCNDVLYYLNDEDRNALLRDFYLLLRPGGRVIMNLPALNAFRGKHDIAVDITRRFSRRDLDSVFKGCEYTSIRSVYWPFLLSPVVFLVRAGQQLSDMLWGNASIKSDVSTPHVLLNSLLFQIARFENEFLPWKPFGSSLFIVANKGE